MTQIALPDGSIVNFPDDMSDNDIKMFCVKISY